MASQILTTGLAVVFFMTTASVLAQRGEAGDVSITALAPPVPANSRLSRVTRDAEGTVYLSWIVENEGAARLQYARLHGGRWSDPHTISEGSDWFINWADFPMLSVGDAPMAAHWLSRSGGGTYDYDISASFYDGLEREWGEPVTINTDGIGAEHGFVSMLPWNGSTLITWLDGRNTKRRPTAGPMSLRTALFDRKGGRKEEWELDARVCDCCATATALSEQGPVIVYRDRSPDEVRDISIVRLVNGRWSQPATVGRDDWRVRGCPVNGPAVAAAAREVAVAWFSARDDVPKVQLALSSDSGASFAPPIIVAAANTIGRVDITILNNGVIAVSWIESVESTDATESAARVMLSRFDANGTFLGATEIATTSPSRRSGFPSIESVGDAVYVSWTDVTAVSQVRVARVTFDQG